MDGTMLGGMMKNVRVCIFVVQEYWSWSRHSWTKLMAAQLNCSSNTNRSDNCMVLYHNLLFRTLINPGFGFFLKTCSKVQFFSANVSTQSSTLFRLHSTSSRAMSVIDLPSQSQIPNEIMSDDEDDKIPSDCLLNADNVGKSKREIICGDSIEWLSKMTTTFPVGTCGFTSLPDICEMPTVFGLSNYQEYKKWFTDTVALFMTRLPERSYVVFLQSDVRVIRNGSNDVIEWMDKSHLCSTAADRTGCTLMWHKLVCLHEIMGKRSTGRPTYSHLLCYAKQPTTAAAATTPDGTTADNNANIESESAAAKSQHNKGMKSRPAEPKLLETYRTGSFAIPDIFYRGEMLWPKGIGLDCCYAGVAFLKDVAKATCIVDPFAGQGTVVAMANALGVDAIGVEISPKRCKRAKRLNLSEKLDLISPSIRRIELLEVKEREAAALEAASKHVPRAKPQDSQSAHSGDNNSSVAISVDELTEATQKLDVVDNVHKDV